MNHNLTHTKIMGAVATALSLTAFQAHADNTDKEELSPWFVRVGPAGVRLHVSAVGESPRGTVVPGSSFDANNGATLGMGLGYAINDRWDAHFTIGTPITTTIKAGGSLAPIGAVGKLTYGPGVAGVTYKFINTSNFTPYIGAGIVRLVAFKTRDAGLENFNVKDAWGSAFNFGVEMKINKRYSLFADYRKIFIKSSATGNVTALGGAPAYARITVDPEVFQIGISYRF